MEGRGGNRCAAGAVVRAGFDGLNGHSKNNQPTVTEEDDRLEPSALTVTTLTTVGP